MGNKNYTTNTSTKATASSSKTHNKDHYLYLRQHNKLSKPITKKLTFSFKKHAFSNKHILPQPQPPAPVYNISVKDFKDVVQKLTGSPSHSHSHNPIFTPPPIHQPKPPSSRLQRIRPPPLAQISSRPPQPSLNGAFAVPSNPINAVATPFSPLPPLPSVRVAAESPVTAYMRFLKNSVPSSPVPLLSPSVLFPSPGWRDL